MTSSLTTCIAYYNEGECLHCQEALRRQAEKEVDRDMVEWKEKAQRWGIVLKPEYEINMRNIFLARRGVLPPDTPRYGEIMEAAHTTAALKRGVMQ